VQVWDALTGANVLKYTGQTGSVKTVAWSPNGQYLASSGYDGTVQVWKAADGTQMDTYHDHALSVYAVAWSPDGTRLASGGDDGFIVEDALSGDHVLKYPPVP
jgi:WD40 repeat protein